MDTLLSGLFALMEDRCEGELVRTHEYRERYAAREKSLIELQQGMGQKFRDELDLVMLECAELDIQAAFAWGLRLGLALHGI